MTVHQKKRTEQQNELKETQHVFDGSPQMMKIQVNIYNNIKCSFYNYHSRDENECHESLN